MSDKIKVAFIYKQTCDFMTGTFFANAYYHFFIDALERNNRIAVTNFPADDKFDTRQLKDEFDVILLCENHPKGTPDELVGIEDLNIPVICRVNDAHDARLKGKIQYHAKYKIDHYFGYLPESFFYKYYPKNFKYKLIVYGLEPSVYNDIKPFKDRIKNRILCSGAAASTRWRTRTLERIQRFRGETSMYKHYRLRTKCIMLPYVDYTGTLQHEYVHDKYPLLLSKYAGSIAAHSLYPVIKYLEIPAAGCLTFMEVTEKNRADVFGFKDNETAIFINEKNYKEKFEEFLSEPDNPKWEEIADAGRQFVMNNRNNDNAVDSLVDLMEEVIDR